MAKTIALFVLILATCPAYAESSKSEFGAQSPTREGATELSLFGSIDIEAPNGDDIDLRAGYGWFVKDDLLVKCSYQWVVVEDIAPGENDYRAQQLNLSTEFMFNSGSRTIPYLGIEVGWRNTKFGAVRESGLVFGPKAGVRIYLNDFVSIDSSVSFRLSTEDVFIVDFEATDRYIFPGIGINASF